MKRLAMLAVCAAAAGVLGCDPICTEGDLKCEGNAALYCVGPSETTNGRVFWTGEACGDRFCRTKAAAGGKLIAAVCSLSPDLDPACQLEGFRCAGSALVACKGGYRVANVEECGSPALCKDFGSCVLSPDPVPACAASMSFDYERTVCDGDHDLTCIRGYLRHDRNCGPGLCYSPAPRADGAPPPAATCVLSREADPRCVDTTLKLFTSPDVDPRVSSGCDGNQLFACVDRMVTQINDCAPKHCDRSAGYALPACEPREPVQGTGGSR